jgi:hypothetical protein
MKLLLLGKSSDYEEVVTLIKSLQGKFEIEVEDIDGYNTILTLEKEKAPS